MSLLKKNLLLTGLFAATYWLAGCGDASKPQPAPVQTSHDDRDHKDGDSHDHGKGEHQHGEWWCNEHGVPEAECAQCSAKVAAVFQKKGDWCKVHDDRPDSQCFICHPEKFAEFAAKYEAKFGKQPPKPELN